MITFLRFLGDLRPWIQKDKNQELLEHLNVKKKENETLKDKLSKTQINETAYKELKGHHKKLVKVAREKDVNIAILEKANKDLTDRNQEYQTQVEDLKYDLEKRNVEDAESAVIQAMNGKLLNAKKEKEELMDELHRLRNSIENVRKSKVEYR